MSITKEKKISMSFNNNVFFRFSFLGDNQRSKVLRVGIIETALSKQIEGMVDSIFEGDVFTTFK